MFNFNCYFHALICYHDFQISWTKIIMLSMLACTFTLWIIHEIMVSLLLWKFWFLWNTERAWKGGERGEGKVVLQKYLKLCLFLAPFAPYKFMLLLLPWFFNSLLLTWERDNVKGGKLKILQFLHLYYTLLLSFLQFYALVVSMKKCFLRHTLEHQKRWGSGKWGKLFYKSL